MEKSKCSSSVKKFTQYWFLLSVLIFAGIFIKMFVFTYGNNGYVDFVTYYMGASILKSGMGSLFFDLITQINFLTNILGFEPTVQILVYRSLPAAALLFIPATFFYHKTAYRIYLVLNLIIYLLIGKKVNKILNNKYAGYVLIISFFPIIRALINNQLGVFFVLLYFLIYAALLKKKIFWAGFLAGLVSVKLNIFVATAFILFLFIKDRKTFLAGVLLSFGLVFLVSYLLAGPGFPFNYIDFVIATESPQYGGMAHSYFSLQPLLLLIAGKIVGLKYLIILNYVLFFCVSLFLKKRFRNFSDDDLISLTVLMSVIFGFHVLFYESVILVIAFILFVKKYYIQKKEDPTFYIVLVFIHAGVLFFGFYPGLPNILKPLFLIFWLVFLLSGYNLDLFRNALKSLPIKRFLVK